MRILDKLYTSPILRRIGRILTTVLFGISLVVCIVIGSFATFATDADYYRQVQREVGVTHYIAGLSSEENMMIANRSLADYMAGRIDDMQVTIINYGAEVPLWSEQAIKHMKDVRELVSTWSTIALVLGVYMVAYAVYHMISKDGRDRLTKEVLGVYEIVGVILLLLVMSVAIFGFDEVFEIFHKVFFSNNDWLFPGSDIMIRLLPENFFFTMALRGALTIAVVVVITSILAICYRVKRRKELDIDI